MKHSLRLCLMLAAVAGLVAGGVRADQHDACPTTASHTFIVGGNQQEFTLEYVDGSYSLENGQTTICYDLSGPATMSHMVLELCEELFENLDSATHNGNSISLVWGFDPTTGLTGGKIDPAPTGRYCFTFDGYWVLGCTEVAFKQGNDESPHLPIVGLLCEEIVASLEVTKSAPEEICAGEDVTYEYTVTNTGNIPLLVNLVDDNGTPDDDSDDVDIDGGAGVSLDPGEDANFIYIAVITETTTNIVTATGANGDLETTATATATVTVVGEAPTIACPADLEVECGDSTHPDDTGYPTVTGDPEPTVTYEDEITEQECGYIITRTWTAENDCGIATCVQVITVVDTTPPAFNEELPADAEYECLDEVPAAAELTATDNCDGDVDVNFEETVEGECPTIITRTWTAVDACGNEVTHTQTITVDDQTAPVFNEELPADAEYECLDEVPAAAELTATDNCDGDVDVNFEETVEGECPTIITRTWTAVDACGNEVTHTQIITVHDVTDPVITCPEDITVEAESAEGAIVDFEVEASDNCGTVVLEYSHEPGSLFPCGDTIVSVTATDACGNTATCTFTITVICELDEGCTPGYWRQPQHFGSWVPTGYAPDDTLTSVFEANALAGTLLDGLQFGGGSGVVGAKQILLRAAVAALLNAAHPDINYPMTEQEVIDAVTAALNSNNRGTMLSLATTLDEYNNSGCPLGLDPGN
jgi:hypothetical protein